jgi:hypothetical protein
LGAIPLEQSTEAGMALPMGLLNGGACFDDLDCNARCQRVHENVEKLQREKLHELIQEKGLTRPAPSSKSINKACYYLLLHRSHSSHHHSTLQASISASIPFNSDVKNSTSARSVARNFSFRYCRWRSTREFRRATVLRRSSVATVSENAFKKIAKASIKSFLEE